MLVPSAFGLRRRLTWDVKCLLFPVDFFTLFLNNFSEPNRW